MKHLPVKRLAAGLSVAFLSACHLAAPASQKSQANERETETRIIALARQTHDFVHGGIRQVQSAPIGGQDSASCRALKKNMPTVIVGDHPDLYAAACGVRSQVDIHSHFNDVFASCNHLETSAYSTGQLGQIQSCLAIARPYVDSQELPLDIEALNSLQRSANRIALAQAAPAH